MRRRFLLVGLIGLAGILGLVSGSSAALNSDGHAGVSSVSCAAAGDCAAGGHYVDGPNYTQAFVVTAMSYSVAYEANGATGGSAPSDGSSPYSYGSTVTVLGAGSLTRTGHTFTGWNTAANGGGTSYSPGGTFSMPASAVTLYAQWAIKLRADKTTCKGTYSGTGEDVVVPAGATCTLIPGTRVEGSVVVKHGGTLHINGVRIRVNLTTSGSATVCGSRIGRDVVATGGSFVLGGPGCAGNKIFGDTFVTHDANNVTVQGNTVSNGLTVKKLTGGTDSIVGNVIFGGLLVAHSGPPVEVSGNHASTARCVNNAGQTGSGNHAGTGINTCPQ